MTAKASAKDLRNSRLELELHVLSMQTLKATGNRAELHLPVSQLAALPALQAVHVDRPLREALARDPAAAPLLHWLRF